MITLPCTCVHSQPMRLGMSHWMLGRWRAGEAGSCQIGEKNEEGADGQVEHQGHCGGAQPPLPASLPDRCLGTESQRLAAVEAVSKEGRGSGTTMDPFFICPYNFGTSVLPALLCKYTGLLFLCSSANFCNFNIKKRS
jgi:hypothetical protein